MWFKSNPRTPDKFIQLEKFILEPIKKFEKD